MGLTDPEVVVERGGLDNGGRGGAVAGTGFGDAAAKDAMGETADFGGEEEERDAREARRRGFSCGLVSTFSGAPNPRARKSMEKPRRA